MDGFYFLQSDAVVIITSRTRKQNSMGAMSSWILVDVR